MRRMLSAAGILLVTLGISPAVWAQQTRESYGPHMWGGGWYGWIFGPIMMILFIAAAVIVVVLIVRWLGGPGHGLSSPPAGPPSKTPSDILKERFARGEIDKDEFEERRKILGD